jgi:hypothetical protein
MFSAQQELKRDEEKSFNNLGSDYFSGTYGS